MQGSTTFGSFNTEMNKTNFLRPFGGQGVKMCKISFLAASLRPFGGQGVKTNKICLLKPSWRNLPANLRKMSKMAHLAFFWTTWLLSGLSGQYLIYI